MKHRKIISLDQKLPFPLRRALATWGPVEVYEIPEKEKSAVLKKLYPFRSIPALEDVMEDIHAEKTFRIKDFMVTREGTMNVLASPYYLESGGTVIDWFPIDKDNKREDGV